MRVQSLVAAVALAGFCAVGVSGAWLGWGTDRDSIRVIQAAASILAGHYQRSRSFGFPLHEAATALLYACGGLVAANLGSVVVTALGIGAALRVAQFVAPARVALAAVALCTAPMLLVDANAAIDFGWSFTAGMVLLLAATGVLHGGSPVLLGLATLAALLLRPDNGLFVAAVAGALAGSVNRGRWSIALAVLAGGAAAGGIYDWLNGAHVLWTGVTTTRPFWARLARAVVCGTAACGPGGLLAVVLLALRRELQEVPEAKLLRRVAGLCWLMYVPRFVALPDQADYLVLPVTTTFLLAACVLPTRRAIVCVVLGAVPAVMTMSVFQRDPHSGALGIALALQPGAIAQDRAARRFAMDLARPDIAKFVAGRLTGSNAPASLSYDIYMPGYVSPARDLIIGQANVYRVLLRGTALGDLATVRRSAYRTIWSCNELLGPGLGWRGWEAPVPEPRLTPASGLNCVPAKG